MTEHSTNIHGYYYFESGLILGGIREIWEESSGVDRLQRVDCVDADGQLRKADRLVHRAQVAPPPVPGVPCTHVIPNSAICIV